MRITNKLNGILIIACLLFICACAKAHSGSVSKSSDSAMTSLLVNASAISDINKSPLKYKNSKVIIKGRYMGWSGSCKSKPPLYKSDFMVEDNSGCIYVSGRWPVGINSTGTDRGKEIVIEGIVRIDDNGDAFIVINN